MFRLTQIGPEGGDCTAPYTVTFDKVYTLEEFVNAIIVNRSGEWGSIRLGNLFGKTLCEYKWGKIIRSIPDEYNSSIECIWRLERDGLLCPSSSCRIVCNNNS